MIIRIVKMTFKEDDLEAFLANVDQRKERIRNFEGCSYLQVLQDKKEAAVIFTHSHWESEAALNNYRTSDFFKEIWSQTKPKFAAKPEAWSLETVFDLP